MIPDEKKGNKGIKARDVPKTMPRISRGRRVFKRNVRERARAKERPPKRPSKMMARG